MKKIGCFKKDEQGLHGTIAVLQFEAKARIIPAKIKPSPGSADFLILKASGDEGFEVELGSVWKKYSVQQRVPYLAVTLDDPALSHPIKAILWEDTGDNLWYLYWNRNATGDHMAESLYVQEDLKPQLGIRPLMKITQNILRYYPELITG